MSKKKMLCFSFGVSILIFAISMPILIHSRRGGGPVGAFSASFCFALIGGFYLYCVLAKREKCNIRTKADGIINGQVSAGEVGAVKINEIVGKLFSYTQGKAERISVEPELITDQQKKEDMQRIIKLNQILEGLEENK